MVSTSSAYSTAAEPPSDNINLEEGSHASDKILSDNTLKKAIWGPFYYFSILSLQLRPVKSSKVACHYQTFATYLPNILSCLILFGRGLYTVYFMFRATALTENWCYTKGLMFFGIHGFLSSAVLSIFRYRNFFETSLELFRRATNEKVTIKLGLFKISHLKYYIFTIIFFTGMIFYCISNVYLYPEKVQKYEDMGAPKNETQTFRKSMFQHQYLFFLDAIIILWGAYLSTMCLGIYLCTDRALCQEYRNFLKDLETKISTKAILKPEIIAEVDGQIINYLLLAKHINDSASKLLQTSFFIGLFMDLTSLFSLEAFGSYIGIDKILFGTWVVTGISLLAISIRTPSVFQALVLKTVDALYLDQGIWRECKDENVKKVARDIVNRLTDADFGTKGLAFTSASALLFSLIVIIIPFIVNVLSAYAIMPTFVVP